MSKSYESNALGSTIVMYAANPAPWEVPASPYDPPYVPAPFVPSPPLDPEVSREFLEALVRQAVRKLEDRHAETEKRLAQAEARIAQLEREVNEGKVRT